MALLSGWTQFEIIKVPAAYITGNLTSFPLTVLIPADSFLGTFCLTNGHDIRFTSADGANTVYPYERESFTGGALATGIFHVQLPTLTSGADYYFYMQFGNAGASDGSSASSPWDAYSKAVWHFGTPSTLNATDSTTNNNSTATLNGTSAGIGIIGGCASFNGSSNFLTIGNTASTQFTNNLTISFWVKILANANASWHGIVNKRNASVSSCNYGCNFNSTNFQQFYRGGSGFEA